MSRLDKPFVSVLAVLGLLSFFPLTVPSSNLITGEKSEFFKTFPVVIAGWAGTEVEPDERTLEILETRNVLSRNYTSPSGETVHLLLVSSQKDRRVAHPPEVCYIGSNYNIFDEKEGSVEIGQQQIPVKEFMAVFERNPDRKQRVLYLYKVGNRFTTNYYAQQLHFALDRLGNRASEVLLIRLAGENRDSVKSFLEEILPLLTPQMT